MPQFNPEFFASQLVWLGIVFVLLYLIMSRLVLPRIGEVLEERSERIADDLDKAESLKKEAEGVIAAYEAALEKARGEASAVLAQAGQEVSEMAANRQAEFARGLAEKTAAAEERIAKAKEEAKAQIRDIAVGAASEVVSKLTGSSADESAISGSVDAALKEPR